MDKTKIALNLNGSSLDKLQSKKQQLAAMATKI
jgi:hypothetical protein